ncbi:hypothetical protein G3T14_20325 [Methylobacterium sp. BTF04]|uniref:hypothetical protein n=1 Tax=Methylobacterium sp. BTF04 TaxID=2708300 RepID=UPI0013D6E75C|nr:hypothetical protein [Methylobacterium sp. BTF04]NEU14453.1 hypothetical protein [Methylobacterium sp. BTF04]
MEIPFRIAIILATGFAVMTPLIFIAVREAIKRQRQEVITDLALVFEIADRSGPALIPSFEFVKYKYFVGSKGRPAPDAGLNAGALESGRRKQDYTTLSWLFGATPFSVLSGLATLYTLSLIVSLLVPGDTDPAPFRWPGVTYPSPDSIGMVWLLGLCAAFAGSYITALRNLYRAIKNFDLSPGSFIGETIRMLLSAVLSPILVVGLFWLGTETVKALVTDQARLNSPAALAMVVAACFIAGIMPEVVLRNIVQRDKLKNFKREEEEVFQAFKITPVEIIDGIDSDIRVRLDDHHIHSTQNLAAANPLMLFVETPYGVYQIMDWVAQAQLCCSVGRDKVIRLWPLGVRTLFDLERLAASRDAANAALLLEVGRVILGEGLIPTDVPDLKASAALVRASIELRLDDPHVQRLRQIYIAVGARLGRNSRRFRSSGDRYRCRYRAGRGWLCRRMRPQARAAA